MRKASATEPTAMPPITGSEKRSFRPSNPLIAAPRSGSRGTSQMYLYILRLWSLVFGLRSSVFGLWSSLFRLLPLQGLRPKTKDPISPLQQVDFINPDRFLVPIKRDHDSQTNRRF